MTGFADAQAGSVTGHEQDAELGAREGGEQGLKFVAVQDDRQRPHPVLGAGDAVDVPGAVQGDGVEELEGGVDLAVGLVGELADLDAVHQECADLGLA